MNVEVEEVEPGVKKIRIEIPANRLEEESEVAYRNLGKRVKVPGFRKGKVPRAMIERMYSQDVLNDVANRLISNAYVEAIKIKHLHPVNEPQIENVRVENKQAISFTATVEVLPQVELGDISDIEVVRKNREITDEDVQKELERIREVHAQFAGVDDRPIREEDLVRMDFEGKVDGESVPSLAKTDQHIRIHTGDILKDFYTALIGLKEGEEKDLKVSMPNEYPDPAIAGKEVDFHVKIYDVREKILLDLDDDFAVQVGDKKTLDELKNQIRSELAERAKRETDQAFQKDVMGRLAEKHPFDIPQKLIDRNADQIAHNMEHTLQHGGIKLPESEEGRQKFVEGLRQNAIDSIREEVLIQAVSEKEGIRVEPEEVDAEISVYAEKMGESLDVLKKRLEKEGAIGRIARDLLIKKTYDFIQSKVKIKEEPISPSESAGETGAGE